MSEYKREEAILAMQKEVSDWCHEKGWEPDPKRTFGDECALLHSEISEALESYREMGFARFIKTPEVVIELPGSENYTGPKVVKGIGVVVPNNPKPEGVPSEFADLLIRLLHYSTVHGINLYQEYRAKMDYNKTRANRHGGKRL